VGFDTELFTRVLPAGEAVVVATPITGNAWLFTFTYNACGRTELSDDVNGDVDAEMATLVVFEVTPLHWVTAVSLARVSTQERFGNEL